MVKAGFEVSVLARGASKTVYPDEVKVFKAEFSDHNALVEAFRGQDVVIVTTGGFFDIESTTIPLIDAAIEAGVKRFIPSGWPSSDLYAGSGSWNEHLIPKYKVRDYLSKKATEGKITWTNIACGLFYDWMFDLGLFNIDIEKKRAGLYDTGDQKIMLTTLGSVADSVVGILKNPEGTKNRSLRIHDFFISNKEVLDTVESLTGVTFETYNISTDDMIAQSRLMPRTDQRVGVFALAISFGSARVVEWETPDDSQLLGLKTKDLREETEISLRKNKLLV